jgi:DNA-binding NtrC family response regulator
MPPPRTTRKSVGASLKGAAKEYPRDQLNRHDGHRRTVAELLGISERTLYRKLVRYELK